MENSVIYSAEINELFGAHAEFMGEVVDPGKSQQGYGYKYADLSQILGASRPILSLFGLSLTQFPTFQRYSSEMVMELPPVKGFVPHLIGEVVIESTLAHKSGQYMRGRLSIPVETMKGLSIAQAVGAAISYGRRYHASAILGIAQEDSDAALPRDNGVDQAVQQSRPPAQNRPQSKPAGPAQVQVISEEQADGLRDRIQAMGRDAGKFATAVAGVPTLNRLPATAYDAACRMLTKAENKQAEAQEAGDAPVADAGDPGAQADPAADAYEADGPDAGDAPAADVA